MMAFSALLGFSVSLSLGGLGFLSEPASDFAPLVDNIHAWVTILSVFFTIAIVGTAIYFAIKYRKRDGVDHETPRIEGSHLLEFIWTAIPTVICIFVAGYGYYGFKKIREVPAAALEIGVTGRQWAWSFKYANGKEVGADDFTVPVGQAIKLNITSKDVLHSFFVPAMRTKMDAVPGRYTMQWFRPVKTGTYDVFCTEYCGTQHSAMLAKMRVVSEDEFNKWLNDKPRPKTPAEIGRGLYVSKACNSCHSLDGSRLVGPSFLNLYGREEKMDDGLKLVADDEYIRESILNAQAKIVEGYPRPSPMPIYEGQLNADDVANLISFIKTVKGEVKTPKVAVAVDTSKLSPAERGKLIYQAKACIGCHSLDGSQVVGPSFKGLYGRQSQMDDGAVVTADDAYIKESILNSQAKIVKGYPKPSPMPPYAGQLSDQDIADVIEFIKTVK